MNKAVQQRRRNTERRRFPDRGNANWEGPVVDYKEVELLRKFLTASSKMMSRKRGGTSASEQRDVRRAIKRARFLALLPYVGI
ncbi:MAG TPA: 30S ribosomal protein S18 [Phycisphaerae bacterium]|nr:30S ribosomal protein S18 [Phycisphaerae bacterium]